MLYCFPALGWINEIRRLVERVDASVFRLINGATANPLLDRIMIFASVCGLGIVQSGVCLLLILAGLLADRLDLRRAGCAGGIAFIASGAISQVAKHIFSRPRPIMVLHDVRIVDGALFSHSFPSGHTTTAFAAAAAFSVFLPRFRYVLIFLACLTGLSRVYLGVHYPFDVVYGAVLGWVIGLGSARLIGPAAEKGHAPEPTASGEVPDQSS